MCTEIQYHKAKRAGINLFSNNIILLYSYLTPVFEVKHYAFVCVDDDFINCGVPEGG